MDLGVIELFARFSRIAAVALTACGLFMIFLDITAPSDPSRLRRRLGGLLGTIAVTPPRLMPGLVLLAAMRAVDRFVVYWFEQSERNAVTAGAFTLIVFIAVPLAALLNWLRGGSPVLLLILLGCVIVTVVLAILSEMNRWPVLTRILSALLFTVVFLVVPIYAFVSLTGRTLIMPISHGALASILLMPLLYVVCHSMILLGTGTNAAPVASLDASAPRRLVTLFVAALPFAFVGTFVALLMWHLLEPEAPMPSNWRTLLITAGSGALATAFTGYLVTPRPRARISLVWALGRLALCLALAAALAVGIKLLLGWSFSKPFVLSALPLVSPVLLIALILLALCFKAVLALLQEIPGSAVAAERPYRVTGILMLLIAASAGWASVSL